MNLKDVIIKCFYYKYKKDFTVKDYLEGIVLNILFMSIFGLFLMIIIAFVESLSGNINSNLGKYSIYIYFGLILYSLIIIGYKRIKYLGISKYWFLVYSISLLLFTIPKIIGIYCLLGIVPILILFFIPKKNDNIYSNLVDELSSQKKSRYFSLKYIKLLSFKTVLSLLFINSFLLYFLYSFLIIGISEFYNSSYFPIIMFFVFLFFYIKFIISFIYIEKPLFISPYKINNEYKDYDIQYLLKLIDINKSNKDLEIELLYKIFDYFFSEYLNNICVKPKKYYDTMLESYEIFRNTNGIKKKYLNLYSSEITKNYNDVLYIFIQVLIKLKLPLFKNTENIFLSIDNDIENSKKIFLNKEIDEIVFNINFNGIFDNKVVDIINKRKVIFENSEFVLIIVYVNIFSLVIMDFFGKKNKE